MLSDRRRRKPKPGTVIQRNGVLAVPAPAPTSAILTLLGAGFRQAACPPMFELADSDGNQTGLLDDSAGDFARLGFTGTTLDEAEQFLKSIPRDPEQDQRDAAIMAALEKLQS